MGQLRKIFSAKFAEPFLRTAEYLQSSLILVYETEELAEIETDRGNAFERPDF